MNTYISQGIGENSPVLALLFPDVTNVHVHLPGTSGNERTLNELQDLGLPFIVIEPELTEKGVTYKDMREYYMSLGIGPFVAYASCTFKWKQKQLNKFYEEHKPCTVYIGITPEESHRRHNFKDTDEIKYSFPLIEFGFTRSRCRRYLQMRGVYAEKSGCYFCPKQKPESWIKLALDDPDLFKKAVELDENTRTELTPGGVAQYWPPPTRLKQRKRT